MSDIVKTSNNPLGRPSDYDFKVKPHLDKIPYWVLLGHTNVEIAKKLDIEMSTFYKYQSEIVEFSDAIKKNKALVNEKVATALYDRAIGQTVEDYEETEETYYIKDKKTGEMRAALDREGNPIVIRKSKVIQRTLPGDVKAQAIWLLNRDRANWYNSGGSNNNINIENNQTNNNINNTLNINTISESDLDSKISYLLEND